MYLARREFPVTFLAVWYVIHFFEMTRNPIEEASWTCHSSQGQSNLLRPCHGYVSCLLMYFSYIASFFIKTQSVILHVSSSNASPIRTTPSCADLCSVRKETITPYLYSIHHPQTHERKRHNSTFKSKLVCSFSIKALIQHTGQVKKVNVMHFDSWNAIARETRWRCEPVTAWNSAPMSSWLPLQRFNPLYTVNLVLEEDERTFSNGC